MNIKISERNKKSGLCYAWTDEAGELSGLELPVIDITHPAFAFEIGDAELDALIDQFVASMKRLENMPASVLQSILQNSILMRGMMVESADTYTSGMMTYLNKLGPDNLGEGYSGPLDRQWAASLTPVTFRWRMRDVAHLLAENLAPILLARGDCPVHLLNIGGGPAMDSLNALILLQKENHGLLSGRQICIHVLDLDPSGPCFGARALAALLAEDVPLYGLAVTFDPIQYDWADTQVLRELIDHLEAGNPVVAGSTEGGLFEYGSDEEIVENLKVLHEGTPDDFGMVGPVVRDATTLDPRLKMTEHFKGRPAIRYIGLEAFQKLVGQAGWMIERTLDGPVHQVVSLKKAEYQVSSCSH